MSVNLQVDFHYLLFNSSAQRAEITKQLRLKTLSLLVCNHHCSNTISQVNLFVPLIDDGKFSIDIK